MNPQIALDLFSKSLDVLSKNGYTIFDIVVVIVLSSFLIKSGYQKIKSIRNTQKEQKRRPATRKELLNALIANHAFEQATYPKQKKTSVLQRKK